MIAVIFIVSSVPRIVIMMYDVIIIDTLRWGNQGRYLSGCSVVGVNSFFVLFDTCVFFHTLTMFF